MTYVITFPCIGVKDASCVDACPVDCIHPKSDEPEFEEAEHLHINPDECIACGACETACPVTAIFEENAVPEQWKHFLKSNADFFARSQKVSKRRLMTCACGHGRGNAGRRTGTPLTRTVTKQVVLIERKRKAETRGPFVLPLLTGNCQVDHHRFATCFLTASMSIKMMVQKLPVLSASSSRRYTRMMEHSNDMEQMDTPGEVMHVLPTAPTFPAIVEPGQLDLVIAAWLDAKGKRSLKTRKAYTDTLATFASFSARGKMVTATTFNQRLSILSSFYNYICNQDFLGNM